MFDIIGTVGTVTSPNGVPFPFDLWSAKFLNAAHVAQLLETLFCCCCCCTLLFAGSVNGKSLFFSSRLRHTPADGQKIKLKLSPLMIPTAVDPQCVRISDLSRDHALCPRYLFPRSPRPPPSPPPRHVSCCTDACLHQSVGARSTGVDAASVERATPLDTCGALK